MATDRIIVFAGVSEDEEARLRLLLRKAAGQLNDHWVCADDESEADVILTDPLTIAGNVAIANAKRLGVPYLVLSDTVRRGEERWTLQRSPTVLDLAGLLNGLELGEVPSLPVVSSQGDDFYNIDLEEPEEPTSEEQDSPPAPARESLQLTPMGAEAQDAEALFRRDPLARAVAVLKTHRLAPETTVESTVGHTGRSELRSVSYGNPFLKNFDDSGKGVIGGGRQNDGEVAEFTLAALLKGGVIYAPSQHHLPGHALLVIDPKLDVFHSEAKLDQLRPYCGPSYGRDDWKPVTTQALKEIRTRMPGRSCAELRFLCALMASVGRLDSRLDPGGSFWLQGVLKLDDSLPQEQRILAAMPEARRLNEIASESGASMEAVMDVINALSASGLLGSRLRDRLR
jgi:hypothetical protein